MKDSDYFTTITEFNDQTPAKSMIKQALKELSPTKGNRFGFFLSIVLALFFSICISFATETVQISLKVTEILLTILLALFACIFAVYSIILAFLSDSYIKKLATIDYEGKSSFLKQSTTYYESVLFLYGIDIGLTGLILIFLNCIPLDFILTNNNAMNIFLASVLLFLYLVFTFRTLYELKCTIYNTIKLFRASIAFKLLSFAKENNDDVDKN